MMKVLIIIILILVYNATIAEYLHSYNLTEHKILPTNSTYTESNIESKITQTTTKSNIGPYGKQKEKIKSSLPKPVKGLLIAIVILTLFLRVFYICCCTTPPESEGYRNMLSMNSKDISPKYKKDRRDDFAIEMSSID
ncbi:hypothetical protein DMN91_002106 [Ooceraea biroi]|nr:uncharacterized protein LOC105281714 [Ooceraea biroi]XP_026831195.1 uncharacterized protein LOC105281714 [Ooceraea biroi]RLU25943.1 hypothetical protein DMN91_002106 [Ooceraea biroi]